jgi:Asp/Glu/hydantoin racemase
MRLSVDTPIVTRGVHELHDLKALDCQGLDIEQTLIDEGPASIEGASDEALAAPAVIAAAAVAAVREDDGDAIVLGCTGFHGCASCVGQALAEAGLEMPVIDPIRIPITVQMARSLVASGLRHSKRTWPTPARKPALGFEGLQRARG